MAGVATLLPPLHASVSFADVVFLLRAVGCSSIFKITITRSYNFNVIVV
jgi:hypothetical protein